jgi:hypothetical protein
MVVGEGLLVVALLTMWAALKRVVSLHETRTLSKLLISFPVRGDMDAVRFDLIFWGILKRMVVGEGLLVVAPLALRAALKRVVSLHETRTLSKLLILPGKGGYGCCQV